MPFHYITSPCQREKRRFQSHNLLNKPKASLTRGCLTFFRKKNFISAFVDEREQFETIP